MWEHFYVADQIYLTFHETQHDVFDESLWRNQLIEQITREVQTFTGQKNFRLFRQRARVECPGGV